MTRVCTKIDLGCVECYGLPVELCNTINIPAGLTPGSNYFLWVQDKFGHLYEDPVTIASDGSFTLNPANYPDGFFCNKGIFNVFLTSDEPGEDIVPFTIASVVYTCAQVTITDPVYRITEDCYIRSTEDSDLTLFINE